jgi:HPt (histidine-containing phosphotransfer) domain-containing protein
MLRARAVDRAHPLFIVALTADVFAARQDRFGAANMDAFLSKPVELAELQALLERAVSEGPPAPSLPLLAPHGLDERVVRELLDERDRQGRPLLDRVLQPLFTSAEAALLELERALQQGNRKQASTIAHRLKGDCLLVGARHAASIASELEAAAQAAPHGGPPPSVEPLRVALADARAALLAQLRALRPW